MRSASLVTSIGALLILACGGTPGPAPGAAPPAIEPPPPVERPLLLESGLSWTYTVRRHEAAGARILLQPSRQASTEVLATWTLSIGEREGDRFRATLERRPAGSGDLPTTTQLVLWEEAGAVRMDVGRGPEPALELIVPPSPVSAERVRCIAHLLGGVVGLCSPAPGGITGAPPLVESGIVSEDLQKGAFVAQFLVGIVSAGIFIPGDSSVRERATLDRFADPSGRYQGRDSALLARYADASGTPAERMDRALSGDLPGLDETAALLAGLSFPDATEAGLVALPRYPEEQRYSLVRIGMHASGDRSNKIRRVARALAHLPDHHDEAQRAALLAFMAGEGRTIAEAMLTGDHGFIVEAFATSKSTFDLDERIIEIAKTRTPTLADASLLVRHIRQPPANVAVARALIDAGAGEDQAAWVRALLPTLSHDQPKLDLMTAYRAALLRLPLAERRTLAEQIAFEDAAAAALLDLD